MKFTPLGIEGAWLVESSVWEDERGSFQEWFKSEEVLEATGFKFSVQQANISSSKKNVIRGIHYSLAPGGQAKWVTCASGRIMDVVVDIRPNSPTYKKIEYVNLQAGDGKSILIGHGLGHAFISLENNTNVSYLLSSPYSPEFEYGIHPLDSELNINWDLGSGLEKSAVISAKDSEAPTLIQGLEEGKLPN
jgi:dTDP-4-dehydrorhamnose 3,5-epimerase